MNKERSKVRKKEIAPSALWHYTSFETLTHLFDMGEDSCIYDGLLNFRFGNPLQTNDKNKVHFFEDYVYKGVQGAALKRKMMETEKTVGSPFALSLICHDDVEKTCPLCEIPMWKMYGDNFKGVRLGFNYKRLLECDGWNLIKCHYLTKARMEEKGQNIMMSFLTQSDEFDIQHVYKDVVCYKTYDWVYENEWRLVVWCNDLSRIKFDQVGRLFIPIKMPLGCLETIEVGPKADYEAIEASLLLAKEKLSCKGIETNFKIKQSKLQIGYI